MSDNYVDNLLNTYNTFLELLPQAIFTDNITYSNNNVLYNSLYDEPPLLNVISHNVESKLNEINYNREKCKNDKCPITFTSFDKDNKVILLDCSHCFEPDAIKTWLKEHKAECPICRFKLESIEKKNAINNNAINNNAINNNFINNNSINNNAINNNDISRNSNDYNTNIFNLIYSTTRNNNINNSSRFNRILNNSNSEIFFDINNLDTANTNYNFTDNSNSNSSYNDYDDDDYNMFFINYI